MLGDILDSLNGMPVNESVQGAMMNVMKRVIGQPLELYIIKVSSSRTAGFIILQVFCKYLRRLVLLYNNRM